MIDLDDHIFGSLTEPVLPRHSGGRFRGRYVLCAIAAISSGPGRSLRRAGRRLLRFALIMAPQGLVWT
jgi:hypothetical protein